MQQRCNRIREMENPETRMVAGFPGKKRERETGFESGSARNTLKGRWFLAPPVRSPTPGPTVTKFVTGTIVNSHIHKSYQKEDRSLLSNIHRYDLDPVERTRIIPALIEETDIQVVPSPPSHHKELLFHHRIQPEVINLKSALAMLSLVS